jgi:hypothetical protein
VENVGSRVIVKKDVAEGVCDQRPQVFFARGKASPKARLLRRDFRVEIFAELLELRMEDRLPAHDPRHVLKAYHRVDGSFEIVQGHEPGLLVVVTEARTVRTILRAEGSDLDLDRVVVADWFHEFSINHSIVLFSPSSISTVGFHPSKDALFKLGRLSSFTD